MSNRDYESRESNQGRNEGSAGSFLLGAIVGGVVGAAAALLFAPNNGKQLRNSLGSNASSIMSKTGQLGETVKTKSNEFAAKTSSLSQGLVQQSSELINKVKGKTAGSDETGKETETNYISIGGSENPKSKREDKSTATDDQIRKKLEEAQMAFDEEENKIKL
ncbi:YtxH domain-containing protein [Neobacillus mesonae]|uniref:YtxH domain-containing protein n=1 Tax=Neobacillus mesonae TaxID=1193713 RepID=A0A3Q9QWW7_9BACI|nr:YtxH domain-containing protein [Neobacillus mesonae]AZU63635.1 hypothetical protein CHR53_21485 [Neobacillus mesonae]